MINVRSEKREMQLACKPMASCISHPFDYPPAPSSPRSHASNIFNFEALSLLQHCSSHNHLKQIHAKLIRHNLHDHQLFANTLLRLYCSHGNLDYASHLFDAMSDPQTFAWNLMIRAHAAHGSPRRALASYYNVMVCRGVPVDKFTFPFAIKACTVCRAVRKGKEVHGLAIKCGYYKDSFIKNTLMNFYLKCGQSDDGRLMFDKMLVKNVVSWTTMLTGLIDSGDLDSARRLFDQMPNRNVVSYTAMIDGYVTSGRPQEAFELFWKMQALGVRPNSFTLVSLLRACTALESVKLGSFLDEYAIKTGFELGVYLGTALIDMYSKCGRLDKALSVFNQMDSKSTATWNAMISGLGVHGFGDEALTLFEKMVKENVKPDAITFVGVLCACVQNNAVDRGLRYFDYMTKVCGVVPILDHYICMFELWNRAKEFQDNT